MLSPRPETAILLRHGTMDISTSAVNLGPAGQFPATKGIWIRNPGANAEVPNTNSLFIGGNSLVTADGSENTGGYELEPGNEIFLEVAYLDSIWLIATTTVKACWLVI